MKNELIQMGALCEEAISLAAKALTDGEFDLAEKAVLLDKEIDQMERDIETLCLKLLLQQQPVACDLRQISAALKIITDMERIGDQAADIAEIILTIRWAHYVPEDVGHIREMAQETIKMVRSSVDSYVHQDIERARAVISSDDIIDRYFIQVRKVLIKKIVDDPTAGEHILDLLMIDKYLERIGDHAVNIAKWVIFSVTGTKGG
ncbi:MAG: phosphate signaling complex protein PhoU [Oscillospiraceae bacterium]|nr:phosphate signaling complex protein PhoU [Oscillospiraceae bacterium]